jgi:Protein of unknown function (DUF3311)
MRWLIAALVAAVYIVHQDSWLWHDKTLVFGFLPSGLAYHAGYCVLAAITMAILVRYAWPQQLEASVPEASPAAPATDLAER